MAAPKDFGAGLRRFAAHQEQQRRVAVEAAALVLVVAIKSELSTPGRGRTYGDHQASAPGDPPAPDSGTLRNSIDHEMQGDTARVGTNIEYAPPLEFGTSKMAPRPFMRPAAEKARAQMGNTIVAVLRRG